MNNTTNNDASPAPESQPPGLIGAVATVGTASVLNVVVGLIRIKLIAVILGPVGVGLYGILTNFNATCTFVFGLGLNFSGVRQFAATDEKLVHDEVRWALTVSNIVLGLVACPVIWILREPLSIATFGTADNSKEIGAMGIVVMLTLMAGARACVLQGLRHLIAFSWHKVIGMLISTILGIAIIMLYPNYGVFALILLTPALNLLIAHIWIRKIMPPAQKPQAKVIVNRCKRLVPVGVGYAASAIVTSVAIVAALSLTLRQNGTGGAGQLQAVLTLSYHYIGFLFLTMQADFYPRLTACLDQIQERHELINQQAKLGLLVSGPIFIAVAATSLWLIPILFSNKFGEASELMRWWVLGDILTIPAWAAGFVLIAQAKARSFFVLQVVSNSIFIGIIYLGFRSGYSLQTLAVAKIALSTTLFFGGSMMIYLSDGFTWDRSVPLYCAVLAGLVTTINLLASEAPLAALVTGLIMAAAVSLYSVYTMLTTMDDGSRITKLIRTIYSRVKRSIAVVK